MTAVLGVDPGGTTGVAVVRFEHGTYSLDAHGGLTGDQAETMRILEAFRWRVVPVAVERFVVSRRAGRSATSGAGEKARNIIGEILGWRALHITVHQATAAEAKRWATDRRLTAAGIRPTDGLPHSRDAARHALYTLVKHYGCPDPLGAAYRRGADQCRPDTPSR